MAPTAICRSSSPGATSLDASHDIADTKHRIDHTKPRNGHCYLFRPSQAERKSDLCRRQRRGLLIRPRPARAGDPPRAPPSPSSARRVRSTYSTTMVSPGLWRRSTIAVTSSGSDTRHAVHRPNLVAAIESGRDTPVCSRAGCWPAPARCGLRAGDRPTRPLRRSASAAPGPLVSAARRSRVRRALDVPREKLLRERRVARDLRQTLLRIVDGVRMGDVAGPGRGGLAVDAPHCPHEIVERDTPVEALAQRRGRGQRNSAAERVVRDVGVRPVRRGRMVVPPSVNGAIRLISSPTARCAPATAAPT